MTSRALATVECKLKSAFNLLAARINRRREGF